MQRLIFLLSYPFLWCVAALPFRIFYLFSDLLFVLVFHLTRYRRKVVQLNLALTFPEKDRRQIGKVEKKFYRHMCDVFLETIKTMKISKAELTKRYRVVNIELLHKLQDERNVLVLIPHYGNWEWSIVVNTVLKYYGYAVYQKIGNRYFDNLIKNIRARFNTRLIHQKEMVRTIIRNQDEGLKAIYGVVSDQSPQAHRTRYWRPFLGITVPVFDTPEIIARRFDLAVVYAKISKLKRGYYEFEFVPIASSGSQSSEHEITDKFFTLTEESIREEPAYYLWTHRRWKHRDSVPEEFID